MTNSAILPIAPFSYSSQNWVVQDLYGRCVITANLVTFTEDFGPFKAGDKFASVDIDANGGWVTAWRKSDRSDSPVTAAVALRVRDGN